MGKVPRLTVGLPVYNGENFLAEALDSLLGQSFEDFELIISDNASADGTADICQSYMKQDSRIRYFRQPRNIGSSPNHNYLVGQARGDLFKWVWHDDLYARDLLKLCVDALDQNPDAVLAHSWTAVIDAAGTVTNLIKYPTETSATSAPERLRSMLFDGWGGGGDGIVRTAVLRRTKLHGSYHFADRTITTEIGLHGPFCQVPDWLYFRRDHPAMAERKHSTVRSRCANLDPRRASRLWHPVARLYVEYVWGYASAIQRAPLSPADRRECYGYLLRWMAGRAGPVFGRSLSGGSIEAEDPVSADLAGISVTDAVPGQDRRHP